MRVRLVEPGRRSGREAITHWSLEETGKAHSLIRIKIDTGRRAQIRLHMANLGAQWQGTLGMGGGRPASTGSASTPHPFHSITQTGRG